MKIRFQKYPSNQTVHKLSHLTLFMCITVCIMKNAFMNMEALFGLASSFSSGHSQYYSYKISNQTAIIKKVPDSKQGKL